MVSPFNDSISNGRQFIGNRQDFPPDKIETTKKITIHGFFCEEILLVRQKEWKKTNNLDNFVARAREREREREMQYRRMTDSIIHSCIHKSSIQKEKNIR